jgi:pimeloyl-ACP methyl ester carboxylesterase
MKTTCQRTAVITLSTVLCFALALPAGAASNPATKCTSTKLKAIGKQAQLELKCYAKSEKKNVAVDSACLGKAADKATKLFDKADSKGGCLTLDDAAIVERAMSGSVRRVVALLQPGGPAGSICTSIKLKTAGKRAAKLLKAHAKAVKKEDASKLPDDVAKEDAKLSKLWGKAEGKGDCQTSGDLMRASATIDSGLDGILGSVRAVASETLEIPSGAEPAETPGSSGVDANDYPNLVTQFGTETFSLNNATYTRFYYQPDGQQPDAILVLVPGFEGGANSFKILAENLVSRAAENGTRLELWAFDRRGQQIEDLEGQDIAEQARDPEILLDWYYGAELGLTLSPELASGPNRRAFFHDAHTDTAFIANWTNLVISRDIDAVIEEARTVAKNQNVFLGGHSAGTGFTARYASTDFDLSGLGPEDPGYANVKGLVLLEGGGGSTSGAAPTADQLDRIEDKADGGLFYAVRDNAPRCVDGTPCTMATEATDCAAKGHEKCTEAAASYATVPGLLNPRVLAAGDVSAIQAILDPDTGENIIGVDHGAPGNNAIDVVPDLSVLGALPDATAYGGLGNFVDDDGSVASLAFFVASSVGAPGPDVGGLQTWQDITELPMPGSVLPDNGPEPTTLPGGDWGQEVEVTRIDRLTQTFYAGGTNFTDWYYPSSGLGTTSGLPGLDSSALSVGRSRRDIENLVEAPNIDVPVICFGGSNGLTPVPGDYTAFGESIGTCTAPSCDGSTPRVVDDATPNEAFPTFGDVAGGFEVHITEGVAHVDIVVAEDDADNNVITPLLAFIQRNAD